MQNRIAFWGLLCSTLAFQAVSVAQENFKSLVGPIKAQDVAASKTIQVPFITWGGDVATFLANGDLKTKAGSTYQTMGLDMQLVPGDDFVAQVKNYVSGKSPFLRGTTHMLGLANEVIGADPKTKPVVILQLSWSAGDHIVSRQAIKTLNDLKGKKIACQQGDRTSACCTTRCKPPSLRTKMLLSYGRKTLLAPTVRLKPFERIRPSMLVA